VLKTMNKQPSSDRLPQGGGDPWSALGYLIAGVAFYGLIGWGLGVWLHASYLAAVGIVVGAGLGLYLVVKGLPKAPPAASDQRKHGPAPSADGEPVGPIDDNRGDAE